MSRIQKCNVRPYQFLMVSVYNYLTSLILTSNELLSAHFPVLKAFALQRMQKNAYTCKYFINTIVFCIWCIFFFFCKFQRTLTLLSQSIVSFLKKTVGSSLITCWVWLTVKNIIQLILTRFCMSSLHARYSWHA